MHQWLVDFPHKGPVMRNMIPFDDVIMSRKLRIVMMPSLYSSLTLEVIIMWNYNATSDDKIGIMTPLSLQWMLKYSWWIVSFDQTKKSIFPLVYEWKIGNKWACVENQTTATDRIIPTVWSGLPLIDCVDEMVVVSEIAGNDEDVVTSQIARFMGPTWGRQDPGGPHVGPMNLFIRDVNDLAFYQWVKSRMKM